MDWFRLPLADLCRNRTVIGIQQLQTQFLPSFCTFLEDDARASVVPLISSANFGPGKVFIGNASNPIRVISSNNRLSLEIDSDQSEELSWHAGLESWLGQLVESAHERLTVYLLSGGQAMPFALVDKLLDNGANIILSPRETVMCRELIDSVQPYLHIFPVQVRCSIPESLLEVL